GRYSAAGKSEIAGYANQYESLLLEILQNVVAIKKQMKQAKNALALAFTFGDIREQLDQLIFRNFLWQTPLDWLQQYPRYLKAIQVRLEKAPADPQKDKLAMAELKDHWQRHEERLTKRGLAAYAEDESW